MNWPKPEPGLVVRYSYLWLREHRLGREEGIKDRPCAIIVATLGPEGESRVLVVPVTHSPPENVKTALEIPQNIKQHLGLDAGKSWVVLSESNLFNWPGPDLRRVGNQGNSSIAYGILPPRFFAEMRRRFLELEAQAQSNRVQRTD